MNDLLFFLQKFPKLVHTLLEYFSTILFVHFHLPRYSLLRFKTRYFFGAEGTFFIDPNSRAFSSRSLALLALSKG